MQKTPARLSAFFECQRSYFQPTKLAGVACEEFLMLHYRKHCSMMGKSFAVTDVITLVMHLVIFKYGNL